MVRPAKLLQARGCESRRGKQAGAPRSRLRVHGGEIPPPERSVAGPGRAVGSVGGEQSCGPNESEPLQPRERSAERRRGRAGRVTAKATDWARETGGVQDPPGVGKAARSDSLERNRRGPPRPPTSGKDPGYKPSAKCPGVGRESEGLIVLGKPGRPGGGKGPCFWSRRRLGVSARA